MKVILPILTVIIFLGIGLGLVIKGNNPTLGAKVVGLGVLGFSFVLMPLFLYHRSKKRKLNDYIMDAEKWSKMSNSLNFKENKKNKKSDKRNS